MIAKPFYLLKKIIFITKFITKSKEKNHYYNKSKTIKVKPPFFYHYPYSNNLISFKMTFIGLIFV
ncbi:hypothetical protein BZK21_03460 [Helicobacter pylori]|nr:hypothetical protein BZK21_03460 [Helicobacter pylori]